MVAALALADLRCQLGNLAGIGRIRYASERVPGVWLWHVQVNIPGPPFGSTTSLARAKAKEAWFAFKEKHGPEKLAKAYAAMNLRLFQSQR